MTGELIYRLPNGETIKSVGTVVHENRTTWWVRDDNHSVVRRFGKKTRLAHRMPKDRSVLFVPKERKVSDD